MSPAPGRRRAPCSHGKAMAVVAGIQIPNPMPRWSAGDRSIGCPMDSRPQVARSRLDLRRRDSGRRRAAFVAGVDPPVGRA